MSDIIVTKSSEATRGGMQAVLVVEGVLGRPTRVDPPKGSTGFGGKDPSDQAKVTLSEATIVEMEAGEPEPDLKDGNFTFWMSYAPKSKERPHVNTFYVQGFLKSAEALDAKRRKVNVSDGSIENLYGTRVTLKHVKREDKAVVLFKKPIEGSDQKETVYGEGYIFVESVESTPEDLMEHARALALGKKVDALKRAFMLDNKTKGATEYKTAIENGTILEMLNLATDANGIIVES